MLPIDTDQLHERRYPERPDYDGGIVRPARSHGACFRGWGPKLFAAALAVSSLAISMKPAVASTQVAITSCPADHGASLLSDPVAETPLGVGASGETVLRVDLAATGRIKSIAIMQSSGNVDLDFAAVRIADDSRYSPAMAACQAIDDSFLYNVTFNNN